jgi:hypothetical protein
MNKLPVSVALAIAACLALASPALAQKGKGFGKGGSVPPFGHGKAGPVRPFEYPKMGNSLPQSTLDQLPPGLRDKPVNQPGLANHLRKLVENKPPTDLLNPSSGLFAQPTLSNSLTQGISNGLPLGLGNLPNNQPGLASQLRQLIPLPTGTPSGFPLLP